MTSAGTSKGAPSMPSRAFAAAASSGPSGSPCAFEVPCLWGAPIADDRLAGDQVRLLGYCEPARSPPRRPAWSSPSTCSARPAAGLEALHLVDRIRQAQRPVDRDAVVVPQDDHAVELVVPGERDRLLADALHEVAVRGEHIGVMVDDVGAVIGRQHPLGEGHADGRRDALAERPGRRLDARLSRSSRDGRASSSGAGGSASARRPSCPRRQ